MVRVLVVSIALVVSASALADIVSVTVFPDRASVVRQFEVELSGQRGEIVHDDLPLALNRDSLRLSARGPEGLRLGAYRLSTLRGSEQTSPRARALQRQLDELRDQRDELHDGLRRRELQLDLLRSLGQGDSPQGGTNIQAGLAALERFGNEVQRLLDEQRALTREQRELSRDIERLERELADLAQPGRDRLGLSLAWESPQEGTAIITLEYTIHAASWRPVYEWRLDTEQAELELIQFAEVQQRSGEDWSEVELTLSLARPAAGGQLPRLMPWWVDVQPETLERVAVTGARVRGAADSVAFAPAPPPVAEADAQWAGAELDDRAFGQAWTVPGRSTVAADNQPQRFALQTQHLDVALSVRAVPLRQPAAWLFAEARYKADAALPAGSVTLFQDNVLVGQHRFNGLAPGGELAASFGVDDRITIEVNLQEDSRSREGRIRRSIRLQRVHEVVVTSAHRRPINFTLLDRKPVSRDDRIDVSLTSGTPTPSAENVDDQPGVLAWARELAPDSETRFTLGYRIEHPEDLEGVIGW
ncbi:MAG: mucoidy inhibitor MuiA family protein [Wenzhouxiangella sp.]